MLYSYPCDTPLDIAFNWGGADFAVSAENFNLGTAEDDTRCIGAISGRALGLGDDTWLLGDRSVLTRELGSPVIDADYERCAAS